MATMSDIRQKYPQYADIPDLQLADALHQKFYADIPKQDFYKSINLTGESFIPGSITSLPRAAEPSMQDKLMGLVETPAIVAGNIGRAITTPVARMFGEAYGGQGTPQGREMGQRAAQTVSEQFYQPRTQTGPQLVGQAVDVLGAIPPTPLTSAGTALSTLAGPAMNQLRPILTQAVTPARNALVSAIRKEEPGMVGMGAASTSEAAMRQERAQRMGIPLTKGEQMPELGLQQFESDIVKQKPELAKPLIELKAKQKQAIVNKFEQMASQTGAEFADPDAYRKVGSIVDEALTKEYQKKFDAYKAKYKAADTSGQTLEEVPYQGLVDFINRQTPTTQQSLAPILQDTLEQLRLNDPTNKGSISIRALEDIYQNIGKKAQPGTPNATYGKDLKGLIDEATEGVGGDLYRTARQSRRQLANDFENNYRVAKLLGTKGGYADRAVALDDVFSHIVLDGSLEEMRTVTKLLKKAGPEGRQAYAELQGQTVEHLKDQLTKNASGQLSFAKLKTAMDSLDREGKLEYMFGKSGASQLRDLKQVVQDALVKDPKAVNWSNTGNVVMRGLENLASIRFPGASQAADIAKNIALKKQIAESVNYNALAPSSTNVNALTGQ
jgi:hypothetical protein